MVSTGVPSLDQMLGDGYPDNSSILLSGPPGIGKEALGYWFTRSGLVQGDYCLYVTHRPTADILKDMKTFGISTDRVPDWMSSSGSTMKVDLNDSARISFGIKETVRLNKDRRIRIVTDILSPLLALNGFDAMYRYWVQLLKELKQYDAVLVAHVEEGMHPPNVITSMEQLFDGVVEMRIFEEGLSLTPLLRIKKMLGTLPEPGYFKFTITRSGIEIMGTKNASVQ